MITTTTTTLENDNNNNNNILENDNLQQQSSIKMPWTIEKNNLRHNLFGDKIIENCLKIVQ